MFLALAATSEAFLLIRFCLLGAFSGGPLPQQVGWDTPWLLKRDGNTRTEWEKENNGVTEIIPLCKGEQGEKKGSAACRQVGATLG